MDMISEKHFQAVREQLPEMFACVEAWSKETVTAEKAMRLLLAAVEALTNIVLYAYPQCSNDRAVILRYWLEDGQMVLELDDFGKPFDPLFDVQINIEKDLKDVTPGGFGRVIIKKFVDKAIYMRKENRNILQLRVNI